MSDVDGLQDQIAVLIKLVQFCDGHTAPTVSEPRRDEDRLVGPIGAGRLSRGHPGLRVRRAFE